MAIARRRSAAASTAPVLPADPCHVRAPGCIVRDRPAVDPETPTGGRNRNLSFPRAIAANSTHEAACRGAAPVADGQGIRPAGVLRNCPAQSPVSPCRDRVPRAGLGRTTATTGGRSGSGGSGGGGGGGSRRRQLPGRRETGPGGGSPENGEEERLLASIARLDTLLREESGDAGGPRHASNEKPASSGRLPSGGEGGARTGLFKGCGEAERKPAARAPAGVGGIAKSRVRRGGGKEARACGLAGRAPTKVRPGLGEDSSERVELGNNPDGNADGAAPAGGPGMFPPLSSHVPAAFAGGEGRGRERGRYAPYDAEEEDGEAGPSPQVPCHPPGGSRYPEARVAYRHPVVGSDQRWGRPGERAPAMNVTSAQYRPRGEGQPAAASTPWAPRYPCSPGRRHRDARGGDDTGGWYEDHHHGYRVAAASVDRRDVREARERNGDWAGERRPDYQATHGHDRGSGGCRAWDGCVLCASSFVSQIAVCDKPRTGV